jgi:hypothetical protein
MNYHMELGRQFGWITGWKEHVKTPGAGRHPSQSRVALQRRRKSKQ